MENAEINNIVKIVGLQYKKKYETMEDLKTLRYGRLMIMTDQDQVKIIEYYYKKFLCNTKSTYFKITIQIECQ